MAASLDPTARKVALQVLRRGPVSRAEIGRELGLSSPSLSRITRSLLDQGIVVECQPVNAGVGRPSLPLDVAPCHASFVGVKLVQDRLYAVLTDLRGDVIDTDEVPGTWSTPADAVTAIAEVVERWRTGEWPSLRAVGVSLAGAVDEEGVVRRALFLGWPPVRLGHLLEQRLGVQATVTNDVHALTIAEHWFGAGRGCTNFAVVTLGVGVGIGVVGNDELLTGHQGAAGLAGPLRLPDGRRICDVVETAHIMGRVGDITGFPVTNKQQTLSLAGEHDAVDAVLIDVAVAVGHLVGTISAITAPERVLVSGDGVDFVMPHAADLQATIRLYADDALALVAVELKELTFHAWARGAAAAAIRVRMVEGA